MPLLSDAKSCFVGTTPVNKIYAGSDLVWPKGVYPDTPGPFDMFYFPFENSTSSFCPWNFYWDINNENPSSKYSFIPGKSGNCLHFDNDLSPGFSNLKINYNSQYNMCGFLAVDGVPVSGPPTEENTPDCPAFSGTQLNEISYGTTWAPTWVPTNIKVAGCVCIRVLSNAISNYLQASTKALT